MTEEIQVAGSELVDRVKSLLAEGRVRHIRVKSPTGDVYFEMPLAVGVIGGAALAFASPWLAMAASLAGLVASVKVEVVRENDQMIAVVEPKLQRQPTGEDEPRPLLRSAAPKRSAAKRAAPAKRNARPAAKTPARGKRDGTARRRPPRRGRRGPTSGRG
jgi:hypothetical protein